MPVGAALNAMFVTTWEMDRELGTISPASACLLKDAQSRDITISELSPMPRATAPNRPRNRPIKTCTCIWSKRPDGIVVRGAKR